MSLRIWDTRRPIDPEFERAWHDVLSARSPHANFTLDGAYLAWEAERERTALAVIAEEGGTVAAFVLRRQGLGYVSGWPWRWQSVVRDAPSTAVCGMSADQAVWIVREAVAATGGRPVRCFLPVAPPPSIPSFCAGHTIVFRVDRSDEELLQAMHPRKRRMVRRAIQKGYEVVEGTTAEHYTVFAELQRETKKRHGLPAGPPLADAPAPGESWREWELPWMWLLVAMRDGTVESGLGDGVHPRGTIEGRAGGSSLQGRQDGAFALLSYEEARRGRDRGHTLINLGGDTVFKREIAGRLAERVTLTCWLAGRHGWDLAGQAEAMLRSARQRTLSLVRRMKRGSVGEGLTGLAGPLLVWADGPMLELVRWLGIARPAS